MWDQECTDITEKTATDLRSVMIQVIDCHIKL